MSTVSSRRFPYRGVVQYIRERRLLLLLLPCLSTLLAIQAAQWGWTKSFDLLVLDSYYQARDAPSPATVAETLPHTKDIVLIRLDHQIPRDLLARLIRHLRQADIIVVDLMLVDRERELSVEEKQEGWFRSEIARWRQEDAVLASAIHDTGNVVLGAWPEEITDKAEPVLVGDQIVVPENQLRTHWQRPPDVMWRNTSLHAHFRVQEENGKVRGVPLWQLASPVAEVLPALSLIAVLHRSGHAGAEIKDGISAESMHSAIANGYLQLGSRRLPVDERGQIPIDYVGGRDCFNVASNNYGYAQAMTFLEPADLKGSIVLIGEASLKSKDVVVTPFGVMSGIQVHANAIATLLSEAGPPVVVAQWLVVLLASGGSLFLVTLLLLRVPLWSSLLCMAAAAGLMLLLGFWLFTEHHSILPAGTPLLALVITYNALALHEYQRTRNILSKLVGHAMLGRMLGIFTPLQLGGNVEVAAAFFSDLRGFSQMAAHLPPPQTSSVLFEYTTTVEAIVSRWGGRPVSYQGDGIFVLFEQGLSGPNFTEHAVRAALELERAFDPLREKWAQAGVTELDLGIGIATGPMLIGLVGAESHMEPGAVGDPINIAARLQSMSRDIGHRVLLSAEAQAQVKSTFPLLHCGSRSVHGRAEPLEVFAVDQASLQASRATAPAPGTVSRRGAKLPLAVRSHAVRNPKPRPGATVE